MHHFVRPLDYYRRDYQLLPTYMQEVATYIHKQTGQPLEECLEYVKAETSPGGRHPIKIPQTMVLVKDKNGDRQIQTMPFDQYLEGVFEAREILSPTLAAYTHPDKKKSLLADYVVGNLAKRKKAKHEMFVAGMAGNKVLRDIKNAEQNTLKIKNNSLSGAHSSPFTILWNKSSHSTLTSTCRTATSYGNANNEKFLYGNRHYWMPDVVKANIISIINHSDYEKMEAVMKTFKLRHPTVEEVMECIRRSSIHYWRSPNQFTIIESLVKALKPIERSAFLYTSDFYHLAQCNPEFCRELLTELSTKLTEPLPMEEAEGWVKKMDANLVAFVSMLCSKELNGSQLGDVKDRPEDYGIVANTARKIIGVLDKYEDFIQVFWVTDNLPASVFQMPSIIRHGAITSDTDSTIFTVQYWTEWYMGQLDFSEKSVAVAATMVYLASQLIRHILARCSANMGVARQDITRLSMKNEYYFPVFCLTSRAKHYFAYIAAQEGNVYKEYETEIKGVALRNSNVPPFIMKKAHGLIRFLMDSIIAGKKISLRQVLRYVASIEDGMRKDIANGSYYLLPKMQIKGIASYKNAETSNYIHYGMWQEVFAPKYGQAPEPPYVAIKVSIDADNPTKLRAWLDSFEDRQVAERMENWLKSNFKKNVTQLLLPEPVLAMSGIPKDIVGGIEIRGLLAQTMEAFYLILESLGYFCKNDNLTQLVSDQQWLLSENWEHGELDIKEK